MEYSVIYDHIDNDDFELIIGHGSKNAPSLSESFLLNTPIDLDFDYNHYSNITLINLKNERKFKPTPDRERFEAKSEESINEIIQKNEFSKADRLKDQITTIDQWYGSNLRFFYSQIGKSVI